MKTKLVTVVFVVFMVAVFLFASLTGPAKASDGGNSTIPGNSTSVVGPPFGTSGNEANSALAAPSVTLAATLNQVINNISWSSADSWTAAWGPILGGQPSSQAFESAITQDISRGDFADALYVARVADVNGYSSSVMQSAIQTALQQIPMSKSLPGLEGDNSTLYGDSGPLAFELHQRFALWGYMYAQNTPSASKWSLTQAYNDFVASYNKPPLNSAFGEMLWADPQSGWAKSYSSRYYDECAETLSVFLIFAEQGVPGALSYADKVWAGLQNHWTGAFYEYALGSRVVECEMGNFAQIIAEYALLKGGAQNVPNWSRVAQDLNYKLLASGWSSPGWSSAGVLNHATITRQTRLWETLGVMMALEEVYPSFTSTQQATYRNMLMGTGMTPAWQGLISSNLYFNGQFAGVGGQGPYNDATIAGAATLFLDGIVPVTGNVAILAREDNYDDFRTQFPSSQFQFDYINHKITIPVNAGQLTFIYGSTPVSYTFPASGVYTMQFSNDWNTITAVNGQQVTPTKPSAPQNLAAVEGINQVTLSWSAPHSNGNSAITNYNIYRGTTSGSETLLVTIGTATTYVDSSATSGQTYYYYVTAANAVGESPASNEVNAVPTAPLKALAVSVSTDKTSYSRGSTVTVTVTVKDGTSGALLNGASVSLKITRSGTTMYTDSEATGASGTAVFTYSIPRTATKGTYQAAATVTLTGYSTGTGQVTFNVN